MRPLAPVLLLPLRGSNVWWMTSTIALKPSRRTVLNLLCLHLAHFSSAREFLLCLNYLHRNVPAWLLFLVSIPKLRPTMATPNSETSLVLIHDVSQKSQLALLPWQEMILFPEPLYPKCHRSTVPLPSQVLWQICQRHETKAPGAKGFIPISSDVGRHVHDTEL